jgi:signal transduction histidine kinase
VSNAVKFTEHGAVTIVARDEPASEFAEISVSDTGRGIAPDEISQVFERFYQGDTSRGSDGGFGLGLAIARLIVEQHGGTIDVQSESGRGSTFRVRLPRALA